MLKPAGSVRVLVCGSGGGGYYVLLYFECVVVYFKVTIVCLSEPLSGLCLPFTLLDIQWLTRLQLF